MTCVQRGFRFAFPVHNTGLVRCERQKGADDP
jgi:hypothetical protein